MTIVFKDNLMWPSFFLLWAGINWFVFYRLWCRLICKRCKTWVIFFITHNCTHSPFVPLRAELKSSQSSQCFKYRRHRVYPPHAPRAFLLSLSLFLSWFEHTISFRQREMPKNTVWASPSGMELRSLNCSIFFLSRKQKITIARIALCKFNDTRFRRKKIAHFLTLNRNFCWQNRNFLYPKRIKTYPDCRLTV